MAFRHSPGIGINDKERFLKGIKQNRIRRFVADSLDGEQAFPQSPHVIRLQEIILVFDEELRRGFQINGFLFEESGGTDQFPQSVIRNFQNRFR